MEPDQWAEVERLYHAALKLEPAARHAFLEDACTGDEGLMKELQSLLLHQREASAFLENPVFRAAAMLGRRTPLELNPGETFSHFRVVCLVGVGGMGEVYRAKDLRLDRDVALKVLSRVLAARPAALARFEREAKAVAALCHPSIVAIHEFGYESGIPFAVTELLEGENLRTHMDRSALPWPRALEIAIAIADGLGVVHQKGITHRDLKPENIFITVDGRIKILDFGLAHIKEIVSGESSDALTEPGVVMGTVGYMSPEQAEGKTTDARSDIFSFGAVLYELLTGQRAFQGSSKISTLAAILHLDPKPLRSLNSGIPRRFESVVARCLRKSPEERYPDVGSLKAALEQGTGKRRRLASIRKRVAPISLGVVAVVLAMAGGILWRHRAHAGATGPPCAAPPPGIVAWWPGEGSAADITGQHNGILVGGVKFAPGEVGNAFSFDGMAAHVEAGESALLAPPSITVEFWMYARGVRPDSTHPVARWGHIYTRWTNSWIFVFDPQRTLSFCIASSTTNDKCASSNVRTSLNRWSHVAGTYDPMVGKIRLYLDGQLTGEQSYSDKMQSVETITSIGCKFAEITCLYGFNGLVDELTIYNRALTPAEIHAIYAVGSGGKCKLPG